MNLGKSIKIALAQREKNSSWLSIQADMTPQQLSRIIRVGKASTNTVDRISSALELSASELIALGEVDYEQK